MARWEDKRRSKLAAEDIYELVRYGTPENYGEYAKRLGLSRVYIISVATRSPSSSFRFHPEAIRAWKDRQESGMVIKQ